MALRRRTLTLTPAGGAGVATDTETLELHGLKRVVAIALDYTSQPATTDVTVTDSGPLGTTLLSVANANTDKVFYPVVANAKSADGAASTLTEQSPVAETLKVTVAQGDPVASGLVVTVVTEEY